MSLADRDYMTPGPTEPDDRPPKPKRWVMLVALLLIAIFVLFALLSIIRASSVNGG